MRLELAADAPYWRSTVSQLLPNGRLHACSIGVAGLCLFTFWIRETPEKIEAWLSGCTPLGQPQDVERTTFATVASAVGWAQHRALELLSEAHRIAQTLPSLKVPR